MQAVIRPHLLSNREQFLKDIDFGMTVAEVVDRLHEVDSSIRRTNLAVLIDGVTVPREFWAQRRIQRSDSRVEIATVLHGGGRAKQILGTVALIVLSVYAGPLAGMLTGAGGALAGIVSPLIAKAGIMLIGALLINRIFAPPKTSATGGGESSPTYSFSGQSNQPRRYARLPRIYGRHRYIADLAALPYTVNIGDDTYLYALYSFGYGPLKLEDFRIGQNPLTNYDNYELRVHENFTSATELELFRNDVWQDSVSFELKYGQPATVTTQTATERAVVDVSFPNGLLYIDGKGKWNPSPTVMSFQYRALGASTWLPALITEHSRGGQRSSLKFYVSDVPGFSPHDDGRMELVDGVYVPIVKYGWPIGTTELHGYVPEGGPYPGPGSKLFLPGFTATVSAVAVVPPFGSSGRVRFGNTDYLVASIALTEGLPNDLPVGDGAFFYYSVSPGVTTGTNEIRLNEKQQSAFTLSAVIDFPAPGQYEILVTKADTDWPDDDTGHLWRRFVTAIRSIKNAPPIAPEIPLTIVEISIKATGQLNGSIEQFSAIASSVLRVWDGSQWVHEVSRNPAWVYLDALQGTANARPLADTRIDLDALRAWAVKCDQITAPFVGPMGTCDIVVDRQYTLWELLQNIAATGRASPTLRDNKYSVLVDSDDRVAVQMFTPRNSKNLRSQRSYLDEPHAFRVKWIDSLNNYEQAETLVYNTGYSQLNATVFEDLQAFGITRGEQALRWGRYMLAQAKLRQEKFSLETDIENIVCVRGDKVMVAHDVIEVGGYATRIVEIEGQRIFVDAPPTLDEVVDPADYGVRIRQNDGYISDVMEVIAIGNDGEFDYIDVSGNLTAITADNLLVLGPRAEVVGEYIVESVRPGTDMSATISLEEYAPAVYNAEFTGLEILEYVPQGVGTSSPAVSNLAVTVQLGYDENRRPMATVRAAWRPAPGVLSAPDSYRVWTVNGSGQEEYLGETQNLFWEVGPVDLDTLNGHEFIFRVRPFYGARGLGPLAEASTVVEYVSALAPNIVDFFDVSDLPGGMRRYTWSYTDDAVPPGMAGVEVRWLPGNVSTPNWNAATPVLAGAFALENGVELHQPTGAGIFTFIAKAKDSVGRLSADSYVLVRTLSRDAITDLSPSPTPTGFHATGGYGIVFFQVDNPAYTVGGGHAYTQVYAAVHAAGAPEPAFSSAVPFTNFTGISGTAGAPPATDYRFWAVWVTKAGAQSVVPAGPIATATAIDVAATLTALQGQISQSQLDATLTSRVNLIDASASVPGSVSARVADEATARAAADALEVTNRAAAITAEVSNRDTAIAVETSARVTAVAQEATARAAAVSAEATTRATDITSEANARIAAIAQEVTDRNAAIGVEATARAAAISSEVVARDNAILAEATTRAAAITQEVNDRTAAITAEANTRAAAVTAEANTRASAITTEASARAAAITQEIADRNAAITVETNARISALQDEITARGTAISSEATLRQSGDDALAVSISLITAGVAGGFDYSRIWYFDAGVEGWTSTNATQAWNGGWVDVDGTAADPAFTSPTGLAINGATYPVIRARIRRLAGSGWVGRLLYATAGHGLSLSYYASAAASLAVGDTAIVEFDMTALTVGGTDWVNSVIDQVQFRLGADAADTFSIDWIAIGRNAPGASMAGLMTEQQARISGDDANASSLTALTARVGTAEAGLVTEQTTRANADSALTTSVNSLTSRMGTAESNITSEQTTRANADTAFTTSINTLKASAQPAGNVLENSEFSTDLSGWTALALTPAPAGGAVGVLGRNLASYFVGDGTAYLYDPNAAGVSANTLYLTQSLIPVVTGQRYQFSAYTGALRCRVTVYVSWQDAAGTTIGYTAAYYNDEEKPGGTRLIDFKRLGGFAVAPANAVAARINFSKELTKTGYANSYGFVTRLMFGEAATVDQTVLTPYSPGNIARTALAAVATEQTARASGDTANTSLITALTAKVEADFDTATVWNFDTTVEGFAPTNATMTPQAGGLARFTPGVTTPQYMLSPVISVNGAIYSFIRARITRIAGLASSWGSGRAYYYTAGHNASASFYKSVANPNIAVGQSTVLEWDMSTLNVGGTDWLDNTITRIRLEFGANGDIFDIDWIAIGRKGPGASNAALVTEQTARVAGDSASAALVTSLAAKVEADFDTLLSWNFDTTVEGWQGTNATVAAQSNGTTRVTATSNTPQFLGPTVTGFSGLLYPIVRARVTRVAGDPAVWGSGRVYYTTTGTGSHGFTTSFYKIAPNPVLAIGQTAVIEWDMSALDAGGADWTNGTITRIRIDIGAVAGDSFDYDWVAVGRKSPPASNAALVIEQSTRASGDSANAASITALTSRMGTAESAITTEQTTRASADTALTTSVNNLTSRMGTAEADIVAEQTARSSGDSAITTNLDALTVRVTSAEAGITSEQTARVDGDAALTTSIDTLTSRMGVAESAITTEQTTRASGDSANAVSISALTTRVGTAESAITTEQSTRASADTTLTTNLTALTSRVGTAESNITNEQSTRAAADTTLTTNLTALTSRVSTAESAITTEQTTRASGDSANSASITALTTRMSAAETNITTEQSTRATADTANANSITALTSRVSTAESGLVTEQSTRASADTTLTTNLTALTARIGTAESAITTEQTTRASADSALTTSVNTLKAAAQPAGNQIENSEFSTDLSSWTPLNTSAPPPGGAVGVFGRNLANYFVGDGTAYLYDPNASGTSTLTLYMVQSNLPVVAAQRYQVSAYTGALHCRTGLYISWQDSSGATIGYSGTTWYNDEEKPGGTRLVDFKLTGGFAVAPANAVFAKVNYAKEPTKAGFANSHGFITRIMFAPAATVDQTVLSPYVQGGIARTALSAIATEQTARASGDSANAASITALTSRMGTAESNITTEQSTRAAADTTLTTNLTALTSRVGTAESNIVAEQTARSSGDTTLTTNLTALTSRVTTAESAITTEQSTRASADTANANSITALTTRMGAAESAITTEQNTRASADTANASNITALTSRVSTAESTLTSEQSTRASADSTLTTNLNALTTRVGTAESAITSEQTTRASADTTLTTNVNSLTSRMGAAESAITTEQSTRATADSANASAITVVSSALARGRDVFTQNWNALSDLTANWTPFFTPGPEVSVATSAGYTGTVLCIGNGVGNDTGFWNSNDLIAFDPDKLYRITARFKRTDGNGVVFAGLSGVAADGVTMVSNTGAVGGPGSNYVVANGADPGTGTWVTYTGYVKGWAAVGANGDNAPSTNPKAPAKLHSSIKFIRPLFGVNYYSPTAGTTMVGKIEINAANEDVVAADLVTEQTTRATADTANANSITALTARVSTAESAIISEQTTRANADSASATAITGLTATVNRAIDTFVETWPNAAALTNGWTRWGTTAGEAFVTTDATVQGNVLQIGNNVGDDSAWYYANTLIPFDPNRLYKLTIRAKRTIDTTNGSIYAGVGGVAADGTTFVDYAGTSGSPGSHWIAALAAQPPLGQWVTYTAYIKGWAAAGANGSNAVGSTPTAPAKMHPNVRYIRPLLLGNYGGTGTVFFGQINLSETQADVTAADLVTEQSARVSAEAAITSNITGLTSRMGTAESAITTEQSTRASADTTNANSITALTSRVGAAESAITTEQTTRASADSANATAITSLSSRFNRTRETFIEQWTTLADFADRWASQSGSGEVAITTDAGQPGNVLQVGNNAGNDTGWYSAKTLIAYDPDRLYKMTVRVKRISGSTGVYVYAGVLGVAADGVTIINVFGANSEFAPAWIVANGFSPALGAWTTYTGYFKGTVAAGVTSGDNAPHTDPANPSKLYPGASFIKPVVVVNYDGAGQTLIGPVTIDEAQADLTAAGLVTEISARTSGDTANASSITTLTSRVGNAETTITTQTSSINGLGAQNTVKIDSNGYVTGYGLATTPVNGTPTSAFAVRADSFYVANPTGPGIAPAMPFIVRTVATTINGQAVPVGVYIADAFIENGAITSAKIGVAQITTALIGDAQITTGKIGDLQVDTLKIADNAVSVSLGARINPQTQQTIGGNNNGEYGATTNNGVYATVVETGYGDFPEGTRIFVNCTFRGNGPIKLTIRAYRIDGSLQYGDSEIFNLGQQMAMGWAFQDQVFMNSNIVLPSAGNWKFQLLAQWVSAGIPATAYYLAGSSVLALGVKK